MKKYFIQVCLIISIVCISVQNIVEIENYLYNQNFFFPTESQFEDIYVSEIVTPINLMVNYKFIDVNIKLLGISRFLGNSKYDEVGNQFIKLVLQNKKLFLLPVGIEDYGKTLICHVFINMGNYNLDLSYLLLLNGYVDVQYGRTLNIYHDQMLFQKQNKLGIWKFIVE